MPHLVRSQSNSLSFHNVAFPRGDIGNEGHPPTALWDESALSAALHLPMLSCNKPTVCALHLNAWSSAVFLAAAKRGGGRDSELKRDGIEKGGGRTERRDDGCSLAPALPSVHRGRGEEKCFGWKEKSNCMGQKGERGGLWEEKS
ncbi:hypothetical protein CgunFtcFv8_018519 [Champsocephalus gunnari]|uniref:Uncharacterized protein n=1 Tax=Champsocephalus gunnari TaxID=52237 RepID=A0AAN8BSV3_CHAGU|nr:hypothetical protein CgunFtcFv8_018519 [Champsocephalus gunnari]